MDCYHQRLTGWEAMTSNSKRKLYEFKDNAKKNVRFWMDNGEGRSRTVEEVGGMKMVVAEGGR